MAALCGALLAPSRNSMIALPFWLRPTDATSFENSRSFAIVAERSVHSLVLALLLRLHDQGLGSCLWQHTGGLR
uniref:Putative secreted protein n=1 Tax=Anopheles triannulatus TaxID=58253 RepID=A0A2M4B7U8_9DIPT